MSKGKKTGGRKPQTVAEHFWRKVIITENCWLWTGHKIPKGYGQINIGTEPERKHFSAHRVAYELLIGPIPEGLQLDHLCRNRGCVNPAHLEPVTNRENILRGQGLAAQNARKLRCKRGHEFTEVQKRGNRRCGICNKQNKRTWEIANWERTRERRNETQRARRARAKAD